MTDKQNTRVLHFYTPDMSDYVLFGEAQKLFLVRRLDMRVAVTLLEGTQGAVAVETAAEVSVDLR